MYELKKNGKVFTSKSVGTGPSSYEIRICRAAVSQRWGNTCLTGNPHPQQQTGVTLSPHHRQENTAPQDQTPAQAYRTPLAWTDSAHTLNCRTQTDNICYMHGSLPSAHTLTDFV